MALDMHHNMTNHPPTPEAAERMGAMAEQFVELAELVQSATPEGREQSLALTKLEEGLMWTRAAIARHPDNQA